MGDLVPDNTLITPDAEAGRALAIKVARLTIKAMQQDGEIRKKLRPQYAESADSLVMAGHVVAIEFATIAAANNYWR